MELVSVIVPLYNQENYIQVCLDSIYNDDYPEKEIIIIDDGSKDNSFEKAETWRINNPDRLRSFQLVKQENQGLTVTLNRLVSLAKGDFIVLIAGDDYLLPGGIKARLEALNKHPTWLAVFGDCIVVDEKGVILANSGVKDLYKGNKKALLHPDFIVHELILRWSVPGPVLMVRSSAFEEIGGYDESVAVEDRDFYLRLLARKALGCIDIPVSAYRVHSLSYSKSSGFKSQFYLAMYECNRKNLGLFDGVSRWQLNLVALFSLSFVKIFNEGRESWRIINFLLRIILRISYIIHTLKVRFLDTTI